MSFVENTVLKPDNLLEDVLAEINDDIRKGITADALAARYSLSERHLRRLFTGTFRQSIAEYVRSRKLAATIDDLLATDTSIIDIALNYGFDYEQSYIRAFKREFGITPGNLRKTKKPITDKRHLVYFRDFKDSLKTADGSAGNLNDTPYHYDLWSDSGGVQDIKFLWYGARHGGGAAFKATWNKPDDFAGGVGYFWDNGRHYTLYKNIYVDYHYTRSGRNIACNYSYIGMHGWSRNPNAPDPHMRLIEYYIVDDWFGNKWQSDTTPLTTNTTGGNIIGTVTVDGGTYDIMKNVRINKPSIDGNKTYTQIFSVRRTPRRYGTIFASGHFKKWEELGLPLGNMYEAKFFVEVGSGTGWLDLTHLRLSMENNQRKKL